MLPEPPPRLQVGVVGSGRVGSVLGAALAAAGHDVVAVSAISDASRRRADRLLPGVPVLPPDEVAAAADLVLLTVPDDALAALVGGLGLAGAWRPGQLVVHTAGALGLEVLDPAAVHGALPIALHPVMTFAGRPEDVDRLRGTPFGITTDPELRPVAETLVMEMGGEPVWVPDHARTLYHAALAIGSNHLVTLVNETTSLLANAGVEAPARLVTPLLTVALDNALRLGDQAITGPVSRGDVGTVSAHLAVLAAQAPASLPAYVAMARRTADRAEAAGLLGPAAADAVRARLDAGSAT